MKPNLLARVSMFALSAALAAQAIPSPYQCLTLRSNGQSGNTNISAFAPIMPLRPTAFVPADFAAACSGALAYEVAPAPSWCASLTADPLAKWLATSPFLTAVSAMYCQSFDLPACGVQAASIKFSFCVDDQLGDPPAGPDGNSGSNCNLNFTTNVPIAWLNANGASCTRRGPRGKTRAPRTPSLGPAADHGRATRYAVQRSSASTRSTGPRKTPAPGS
ncbi:MAG TPA: hypothetical protein VFZ65_18010 [Planctomycetota bacterium]|nr:hypothetical protein [Planctomycetota bacterium]